MQDAPGMKVLDGMSEVDDELQTSLPERQVFNVEWDHRGWIVRGGVEGLRRRGCPPGAFFPEPEFPSLLGETRELF
jgi:hypothetical protein